jgi:hypothetical protein
MHDKAPEGEGGDSPILAGMKRVAEAIISLECALIPIVAGTDEAGQLEYFLSGDGEEVQQQVNATAAALRRLCLVMLNSELQDGATLPPESLLELSPAVGQGQGDETIDIARFLAALRYFIAASKTYISVHFDPDRSYSPYFDDMAERMHMEGLVERELAAVTAELEKWWSWTPRPD